MPSPQRSSRGGPTQFGHAMCGFAVSQKTKAVCSSTGQVRSVIGVRRIEQRPAPKLCVWLEDDLTVLTAREHPGQQPAACQTAGQASWSCDVGQQLNGREVIPPLALHFAMNGYISGIYVFARVRASGAKGIPFREGCTSPRGLRCSSGVARSLCWNKCTEIAATRFAGCVSKQSMLPLRAARLYCRVGLFPKLYKIEWCEKEGEYQGTTFAGGLSSKATLFWMSRGLMPERVNFCSCTFTVLPEYGPSNSCTKA
mmetsp:Transcript_15111/g.45624  ORF Transcript_15111/g.45624 Transcript_15111/m.45624 type:complete len:255 (+) Transcript_15111:180-944(+)